MMLEDQVEILPVEDHSEDLDLPIRALADEHVCNRIQVVRDGEEAEDTLDFFFCLGSHSKRSPNRHPKLILGRVQRRHPR